MKLARGVTRIVVLTRRYAFKFPRFALSWKLGLNGLLGNMQEVEWSGMSDRLCPVVFALPGGWLVVQRRAEPLDPAMWKGLDYEAFVDLPDMRLPVEDKHSSFGLLDGRIVAVDYGS